MSLYKTLVAFAVARALLRTLLGHRPTSVFVPQQALEDDTYPLDAFVRSIIGTPAGPSASFAFVPPRNETYMTVEARARRLRLMGLGPPQ